LESSSYLLPSNLLPNLAAVLLLLPNWSASLLLLTDMDGIERFRKDLAGHRLLNARGGGARIRGVEGRSGGMERRR
jgi:hypothetical protein